MVGWRWEEGGSTCERVSGLSNAMDSDEDIDEQEIEELVGNSPTQRNWRGILIALLVICIVCSLIITAVILVTPKDEDEELGEKFTFDDMFSDEFKPRHFAAQWVGDRDVYVYRSREGELMEYDADKNTTSIIMDNSTFRQLNTETYFVSEDLQYVLLAYDIQRLYRHSFLAKYKIYQRKPRDPKDRLLPFPQGQGKEWDDVPLQFAGWASKGIALTFVYENNLYYQPDPETTATQVTNSGKTRDIFNGIPDWVYEEEILHTNKAHWWSPGSQFICYAKFDDTKVPIYRFPTYGPGTSIYGYIDEIAYPKAGDIGDNVNPKVQLFILETDALDVSHKELRPPRELEGKEYYVTLVTWRDNTHLLIAWSNRAQNKSILTLCDAITADCHMNLIETNNEGKGWVTIPDPIFINGGQKFLMVLSERDGNFGFWKHISMITTPLGTEGTKIFLTQGTWDVTELLAYDENTKLVYFQSTNRDPRKRHIFRVGTIESTDLSLKTPECLTCDFPDDCQYISAKFSKSAKHYILHCEGPGVPTYILKSTIDPRHIILEDNAELAARLAKKALPKKEYMEIDTGDGYKIWAEVLLPPILKKEHITKYPLLIHTYGGPGTQKVTEQFGLGWSTFLTSSENVIYASIDGRGSGARGDRFLHKIYRNLGTLEVEDQVTGAKFMKETMQYVDGDRTAIWGWSYGGFVTAHALGNAEYPETFNCGVAVAPVTDWRYYDTVYTERYMGLANSNDNYKGYDNANVSSKAHNFKGKHFMLIHGTADDNVHFQHTAQFVKALTEADVDFRIQVYSDKNHAIGGKTTSRHLHRTITSFLKEECWNGGAPRVNDKYITEVA